MIPQAIDFKYRFVWPYRYLMAPEEFSVLEQYSIPKRFINPRIFRESIQETNRVKVSFMGDLMGVGHKKIFLSNHVRHFLNDSDYTVFNLESVLTTSHGIILQKQYTYEEVFYHLMSQLNADKVIAGVANNHLFDYGTDGVIDTIRTIKASGASYVGTRYRPEVKLAEGLSLRASTQWYDPADNIVNKYTAKPTTDQVINFLHWGQEFSLNPTKEQLAELEELKKSSVCTIGHHSHSPQAIQFDDDYLTAFSLGNMATGFKSEKINNGILMRIDLVQSQNEWIVESCEWDYLHMQVHKDHILLTRRSYDY
jgi:poly-gamma-glutamate capsule biosynthesis protein CapA/YwtB (metallophosphatase superfamily)